jgi:hypothetical protein
MGLGLQ